MLRSFNFVRSHNLAIFFDEHVAAVYLRPRAQ